MLAVEPAIDAVAKCTPPVAHFSDAMHSALCAGIAGILQVEWLGTISTPGWTRVWSRSDRRAGNDVPEVVDDDGTRVRVVVGEFWSRRGPVDGVAANPMCLDVTVPPGVAKRLPLDTYASAFAYVFEGSCSFAYASQPVGVRVEKEYRGEGLNIRDMSGNRTLVRFDSGDEVFIQAGPEGMRFLLVTGPDQGTDCVARSDRHEHP